MKTKTQVLAMLRVLWYELFEVRPADMVLGLLATWLCIEGLSVLVGLLFLLMGVA